MLAPDQIVMLADKITADLISIITALAALVAAVMTVYNTFLAHKHNLTTTQNHADNVGIMQTIRDIQKDNSERIKELSAKPPAPVAPVAVHVASPAVPVVVKPDG